MLVCISLEMSGWIHSSGYLLNVLLESLVTLDGIRSIDSLSE